MTTESPSLDRCDERRKSYRSMALKAIEPCFGCQDPRVAPAVSVTGGGDGRPFVLHLPTMCGESGCLGVHAGSETCFTFFDGRDLRRVLLAVLAGNRRALDEVRALTEAHVTVIKRTAEAVAVQAAALEAWDGY